MQDTRCLRYSLFPGRLDFPFLHLKKFWIQPFEVAKPPVLFRATYIGSTAHTFAVHLAYRTKSSRKLLVFFWRRCLQGSGKQFLSTARCKRNLPRHHYCRCPCISLSAGMSTTAA